MLKHFVRLRIVRLTALAGIAFGVWIHSRIDGGLGAKQAAKGDALEKRFADEMQPFLKRYCFGCHAGKKPEAPLDLSKDATVQAIAKNARHWEDRKSVV